MYHIGDYLRVLFHLGTGKIFWCGSDILSVPSWMLGTLSRYTHVVENTVEQHRLADYGLMSDVHPMLFDNPEKYQKTYVRSDSPTVWMSYHKGREEEYGLDRFLQVCEAAGVQGETF